MWRKGVFACFLFAAGYLLLGGEPARARHPNVLVVTIDTLRADAIGKGTPGIDAFLSGATRFSRARTVAPLTLPAHVSLFTGLLPARHAIHDNVSEPLPPREARSFPLLAEEFHDGGYATAAFVACAVLGEQTGIASGFDVYDCPPGREGWTHGSGSTGEDRVRAAAEWIAKAPAGKPWFLWVHLFDVHAPYLPFPGDARRPPTQGTDPLPELYAGGVRRADAAFEKLLAAAGPDTVVVLSSDHGEGLMDHEESEHGPLCYGATVDAVLAVRAPGLGRGAVDAGLRSVADVPPTLRGLCGLPRRDGDGRDLRGPPHGTLVTESLYAWRIHGWGQCFAATDGDFTLVESGPRVELFDRRTDPGETEPKPLAHPAYERLDRELRRFRSADATPGQGDVLGSVPPYGSVRRRCSGYLPRHENARLLDPRANLKAWMTLETVPSIIQASVRNRDKLPLQDALRLLAGLEAKWPASPRVLQYHAAALAAMADLTRERSLLVQAAWTQLQVIEKGYLAAETVRPAIAFAAGSGDRDAMRTLLGVLERERWQPDADTARALDEAAAALGLREETPLALGPGR